ncbi:hypothetical protein HUJ04_006918, partial [Dendroctonus ponderosae]
MICDANMKILNYNACFPGSTHDTAIWSMSAVKTRRRKIFEQSINRFLVNWLDANPSTPEGRYTKHHISARNMSERCFGVFKQRFRRFLKHRVLHYSPEKAAKILLPCVILHNFAIAELVPEHLGNLDEVTDIQSSQ